MSSEAVPALALTKALLREGPMSSSAYPPSSPPVPQLDGPSSPAPEANAEFEARWAAWLARGRQHDLAVQRRIRVVLLAVVVIGTLAGLAFITPGLR